MEKIVAISGSNSVQSINSLLLDYIVSSIGNTKAQRVDLLAYEIPIYNLDIENEKGIPVEIQIIKNKIKESNGLIIGINEHNSTISAFFKNIIDWLSRSDRNFLSGKKILLVSTSPGARGASAALAYMKQTIPRFGGDVVESFSLPSFQENFDMETHKIKHPSITYGIQEVIASFLHHLTH